MQATRCQTAQATVLDISLLHHAFQFTHSVGEILPQSHGSNSKPLVCPSVSQSPDLRTEIDILICKHRRHQYGSRQAREVGITIRIYFTVFKLCTPVDTKTPFISKKSQTETTAVVCMKLGKEIEIRLRSYC
jgi:hypothetical protein